MPSEWESLTNVHLETHPTARQKAVCAIPISLGSIVLSIPALSTVLLPKQKGKRCDHCLRVEASARLLNCSGCRAYTYCGTKCQLAQWKAHHKKICKKFNQYTASGAYQALPSNEKLDALLLSHLVASLFCSASESGGPLGLLIEDQPTPFSTFSALLSGPSHVQTPPICPMGPKNVLVDDILDELYSRFGNNNFAIHSHLVSVAHGIFPLASRLFNHSCVPNAAAKYIFTESEPPCMEIVALREIRPGEEICIPYLDPALYQTRQQIFNLTYGFTCACPSCTFATQVGPIPQPSEDVAERSKLEKALRDFVFPSLDSQPFNLRLPPEPYRSIPRELLPALHESFLGSLSETFSATSHDGPYSQALDVGITILAVCALLYPPNYPQIGMHILEMGKTAWNAAVKGDEIEGLQERLRVYLAFSLDILCVLGAEGDEEGGPLQEIQLLQGLLERGFLQLIG